MIGIIHCKYQIARKTRIFDTFQTLTSKCWTHNQAKRPSFQDISKTLHKNVRFLKKKENNLKSFQNVYETLMTIVKIFNFFTGKSSQAA